MLFVFDWWLYVIWLKSQRNATYFIAFNIVIHILNTQCQQKWHKVSKNGVLFILKNKRISNIICNWCYII